MINKSESSGRLVDLLHSIAEEEAVSSLVWELKELNPKDWVGVISEFRSPRKEQALIALTRILLKDEDPGIRLNAAETLGVLAESKG